MLGELVTVGLGAGTLISVVEGAMAENGWMERLKVFDRHREFEHLRGVASIPKLHAGKCVTVCDKSKFVTNYFPNLSDLCHM